MAAMGFSFKEIAYIKISATKAPCHDPDARYFICFVVATESTV